MINVTAGLAGSSVTNVDQPLSLYLSISFSLLRPSSQTIRKLLTDTERVPLTLRRVNWFKGRLSRARNTSCFFREISPRLLRNLCLLLGNHNSPATAISISFILIASLSMVKFLINELLLWIVKILFKFF